MVCALQEGSVSPGPPSWHQGALCWHQKGGEMSQLTHTSLLK